MRQRGQVFAILGGQHARRLEVQLHHRHDADADEQRHDERGLEPIEAPVGRRSRIFGGSRDARLEGDGLAPIDRIGDRAFDRQFAGRWAASFRVADETRDFGALSVAADEQQRPRIGLQGVQRLLDGRINRRPRRARLRQGRGQLHQAARLRGGGLGGHAPLRVAAQASGPETRQHAESEPAANEDGECRRLAGGQRAKERTRPDQQELGRD